MAVDARPGYELAWHRGSRRELRRLFELAEDSPVRLEASIERGRVLVARDGHGEAVAHLQLVPVAGRETVEIVSLAVAPTHRLRGLGRRLVEHAVAACRTEGVRTVVVATATADVGNLRFYQRCGFRAESVERDAFTAAHGYPRGLEADGIPVRDRIWFSLALENDG